MKRKKSALLLISAFLITVTVLTAIELVIPVKANAIPQPERLATKQGYIRRNGTVDPPTLPIQRYGSIYRLTDNILNYTFKVERDNVVIDGNGFLLSLPAYGEKGKDAQTKGSNPLILISNKTDIIVKNVTFDKYSTAIDIENSSNIIILQNTMQNGATGIYMIRSANCSLVGNEIVDNSVYGLLIQDSTSLNISYNKISKNQYGAEIQHLTRSIFNGLQYSNITRNDFTDNHYVGLELSGPHSNNQIFENNFINNGDGLSYHVGGLTLNNTVYNNYWNNQGLQIEENGVEAIGSVDQSPLASPISIVFDPSLFPLPSLSPSQNPSPTPTATPSPTETPSPESTSPEPEPFPTMVVAAVSVAVAAVVAVGIMVYWKKRKR